MWVNYTNAGNYIIYVTGKPSSSSGEAIKLNEIPPDTSLEHIKVNPKNGWGGPCGVHKSGRETLSNRGIDNFGTLVSALMAEFDTIWSLINRHSGYCRYGKESVEDIRDWIEYNAPDYGVGYVAPVVFRFNDSIQEITLDPERFDRETVSNLTDEVRDKVRDILIGLMSDPDNDVIGRAIEEHLEERIRDAEEELNTLKLKRQNIGS